MTPAPVQTQRLLLEPVSLDALPFLIELSRRPEVARWLGPGLGPPTDAEVEQRTREHLAHWSRHGFGLWLLRDRATGEPVGQGGLRHADPMPDEVELAWSVIPEQWGRGLATEMARAALAQAFHEVGLESVIAYTLPGNAASRRVMAKLGMEREGEFILRNERFPDGIAQVLYRARRED